MATKRDHNPEHGPDDRAIRNVEVSYEHRDMGARGILLFLVVLAIVGIAIHFLIWGLYVGMEKYAAANDPQLHPLLSKDNHLPARTHMIVPSNVPINPEKFPSPRLQTDDVTDMRTFLKQEDRMLTAQPWKDQSGVVHLPIDRAMDLVVQRRLPSRVTPPPPEAPDQTESGNVAMSEEKKSSDAVSVPGAPKGDTTKPSETEKSMPIPGVKPGEPRNPSRGRGEKQPR
jgi:hypothetical protein